MMTRRITWCWRQLTRQLTRALLPGLEGWRPVIVDLSSVLWAEVELESESTRPR